jgi:hypothetical protein
MNLKSLGLPTHYSNLRPYVDVLTNIANALVHSAIYSGYTFDSWSRVAYTLYYILGFTAIVSHIGQYTMFLHYVGERFSRLSRLRPPSPEKIEVV